MKSNPLLLILFLFFSHDLNGQGILFQEGTFGQIKARAKRENKLIFIDAYTTWCGPCKWMDKNTFKNDTVAEFYNSNFICYKVDIEKGEGIGIAKKYEIKFIPTYLFLDYEGNLVESNMGAFPVEAFIGLGKNALNPTGNYGYFKKQLAKMKDDPVFLRAFIIKNSEKGLNSDSLLDIYFDVESKDSLLSENGFNFITTYAVNPKLKLFGFLIDNRPEYNKILGKSMVDSSLRQFFPRLLFDLIQLGDTSALYISLRVFENLSIPDTENEILNGYISYYELTGDGDKYMETANNFLNKYGNDDNAIWNNMAWYAYENPRITKPEHLEMALGWVKKSMSLETNYHNLDTYASLLYKSGRKSEAMHYAQKAIKKAKKDKIDYSSTSELVKRMKSK